MQHPVNLTAELAPLHADDAIAIELAIDRARQMLLDPDLDFATRKRSKAFLDAARAEGFV